MPLTCAYPVGSLPHLDTGVTFIGITGRFGGQARCIPVGASPKGEWDGSADWAAEYLPEKLTIGAFKSLKDATVDLEPVNVFIGANGSGKSNLRSGFRPHTP